MREVPFPLEIFNPHMGAALEQSCNELSVRFEINKHTISHDSIVVDVFVKEVNHLYIIGKRSSFHQGLVFTPEVMNKWQSLFHHQQVKEIVNL